MKKQITKSVFIVVISLITFLTSCSNISYEDRVKWLMFDHIVYNGDSYYQVHPAKVPFKHCNGKIMVQLVDKKGIPYDKDRFEEAYLYDGDTDATYIYVSSTSSDYMKRSSN
ncbi:MAG: hypothetical protein IKI03_07815 [Clostridia bacterium]|nr:hypothetical protein [Clostridia bacterium]